MNSLNKRKKGAEYEQLAVNFLKKQGASVLNINFRNRMGEIDIICTDGDYLVFAEVKYRKDNSKGTPEEAVNYRKQKNICKVADYYRMLHKISEFTPIRYDVIAICGDDIVWHKNAFEHIW